MQTGQGTFCFSKPKLQEVGVTRLFSGKRKHAAGSIKLDRECPWTSKQSTVHRDFNNKNTYVLEILHKMYRNTTIESTTSTLAFQVDKREPRRRKL